MKPRETLRPTSRLHQSNGTDSNCHSSDSSGPADILGNGRVLGGGCGGSCSGSPCASRGRSSACRSGGNSASTSGRDSVRREWVGLVVVGLDVGIRQGLVLAFDDGHEVELGVGASQSIRKDVASSEVNSLLVQVVGQDDEAGVQSGGSSQDLVEALYNSVGAEAGGDVPVVGVEVSSPDDGSHAHGLSDSANTVVDVAIWRAHGVGRDTGDLANGFTSPAEFGDDLLVGEGCKRRMTPGVNGKLVSGHIFSLKDVWTRDSPRANYEESRLQLDVIHVVQQICSVVRWPVVEADTPGEFIGAADDIGLASASSASPPATTRISSKSRVCRARIVLRSSGSR